MNEHSLIYMTNLYENAMDMNTKLQHEMEILKGANEEHRHLNGKLREENKRLNNIINKALGIANERVNYYHHINKKEILEDWENIFNVLLRRDNE